MAKKASLAPAPARNLANDMAAAQVLKSQLQDAFGEDVDQPLIRDMIEGETGLFEAIDAVLAQIGADMAGIDGIKAFEATLSARKDRLLRRVESLRTMLVTALDMIGERRFERPLATLTLKDVPPKLVVTDEAAIPSEFWKPQDPVLDRKGLGDALKASQRTLEAKLAELAERHAAGEIADSDLPNLRGQIASHFPPIPGAELGNGSVTVQIRFS